MVGSWGCAGVGGGGGSTSVIGAGVVECRVGGAVRTDAGGVAKGGAVGAGSAREGYGSGAGKDGVGAAGVASVVKAPIALQELRVSGLIALTFQ